MGQHKSMSYNDVGSFSGRISNRIEKLQQELHKSPPDEEDN